MVNILVPFIFLVSVQNVKAANILAVLPTPSKGPQYMFTSLLQEISNRGHEITLVATNQELTKHEALENISRIDLDNHLNTIWQKYINILVSNDNQDVVSEVALTLNTVSYFCEALLRTDEIKRLIKESHFDLLLLEASMIPLLSLSHIFKAPVILVSSTDAVWDNYETVGASAHPALFPSILQRRVYNLTTLEKVAETTSYIKVKLKILSNEKRVHVWMKEYFGPDFPSLRELKRNVYALFLNSNAVWSGHRPVSSNVVYMGGIRATEVEQLPQDLQSFLDKSVNGVIYVSFGSIIKPSKLPPKKLLRILNALSELRYDILLKWDSDRIPGSPKNIKIYKWLPQTSVLVHPKIKLFITQGGIQSTFESINAGVPLIGIPMYFDQWYNTEKYINFHIGLQMDLASLTEQKLTEAIRLIVNNKNYTKSIAELRALFYHDGCSMDRAAWIIERVLQPYGRQHLRSPAANITWNEYLDLDFIFFLLLSISVITIVFFVLITLTIVYIYKSFEDIKKKMS